MDDIVGKVRALAGPLCRGKGLELLEVAFRREGGNHVLRVTIEREGGATSVADCMELSRAMGPELEALIPSRFRLEVTSGGAERELKTPTDFRLSVGRHVHLRVKNGPSEGLTGQLLEAREDALALSLPGGEERTIPLAEIEFARRVIVSPGRSGGKGGRNR